MKLSQQITSDGVKASLSIEVQPEAASILLQGFEAHGLDSQTVNDLLLEAIVRTSMPDCIHPLLFQANQQFLQSFQSIALELLLKSVQADDNNLKNGDRRYDG